MNNRLRKACFPLPMAFEVPELRFTLRDGARFAEYLQTQEVDATKLLLGDPTRDRPESPLLKVASPEQWSDSNWWRSEHYDIVVMYGRPEAAMRAIREGSPQTKLCLKMDAGYGVEAEWYPSPAVLAQRYVFYRTVQARPRLHAFARSVVALCRNYWGPHAIARQKRFFALPHHILYENPKALEQSACWFRRHGVSDFQAKLGLVAHPVRDELNFTPQDAKTPCSMVGIANWTATYKDADLMYHTASRVLVRNLRASLRLIGKGSTQLREKILSSASIAPDRIQAWEFVHPQEMRQHLVDCEVYLGTSVCESFCIAVAEGLCCGCSVALPPGIGVPSFRYFASEGSGTLASRRSPEALAAAVETEFERWRTGKHHPVASAAIWGQRFHTSSLTLKLCEMCGFSL